MSKMTSIKEEVAGSVIEGTVAPGFEPVADQFLENFRTHGELGANVCVTHLGDTVLDLWGGIRNERSSEPWEKDTVVTVFSSTKGVTALCINMAIDRGILDLNTPIAEYWPEFGQNGKETATLAMALDHSLGVPHVRDKVRPGGFYDWDYIVSLVAKQEPFWEPGTRNGYHAVTFGWILGEVLRRVTGKTLGTWMREELGEPLDADFWIGLPEEHEERVARLSQRKPKTTDPQSKFLQKILSDPTSPSHLFVANTGGADANSREHHACEMPAGNGIGNGRSLARLYMPFSNGGVANGRRYISQVQISRMSQVAMATHEDATLMIPTRFGLGFMKSTDNRGLVSGQNVPMESCILSGAAFGHVGMGGSLGFADPEAGISFGYAMNRMGLGILLNERGQGLVDATYRALGYRGNEAGIWERAGSGEGCE